jgi:hypothetical protein
MEFERTGEKKAISVQLILNAMENFKSYKDVNCD